MRFVEWGIVAVMLLGTCAAQTPAQTAPQGSGAAAPAAQEPPKPDNNTQSSPPAAAANGAQDKKSDAQANGTSKDRLFFALPNFLTLENAGQVPPMTVKQKFAAAAHGSFDKVEYPWYAALAAIGQAENSEPGYGQGWAGYGKRYGADFADGTLENFMTSAILPSLLHQDPRFFQSSTGSFSHRLGYSVSRIFVTRSDSGRREFNFSEIFGAALSAGIGTYSYHPRADKTLGNTATVWGTQVGLDTITIVIKEFWPDVRRKMKKQPKPGDVPKNP